MAGGAGDASIATFLLLFHLSYFSAACCVNSGIVGWLDRGRRRSRLDDRNKDVFNSKNSRRSLRQRSVLLNFQCRPLQHLRLSSSSFGFRSAVRPVCPCLRRTRCRSSLGRVEANSSGRNIVLRLFPVEDRWTGRGSFELSAGCGISGSIISGARAGGSAFLGFATSFGIRRAIRL